MMREGIDWDYIKHLMVKAFCRNNKPCYIDNNNRKMVVAFMRDWYEDYSTIFISLSGSPPIAYAILQCHGFNPYRDVEVNVHTIKIYGIWLGHYKTYRYENPVKLSLSELYMREDVEVMNQKR